MATPYPTLHRRILTAAVLAVAVAGCGTDTAPAADAEPAARESFEMVTLGAAVAGFTPDVDVTLRTGTGSAGEPDTTTARIHTSVRTDTPIDDTALDTIIELWVDDYGYTVVDTRDRVTVLERDGRTAEVGSPDTGRAWIEVTTEAFPADAAAAALDTN